MRKLMAMAVMSVAMLATASPAFAQAVAGGGIATDDDVTTTSVQFVDASQFQSTVQIQAGDATAAAGDGSVAVAGNYQGIYQVQYNGGF